MSGPPPAGPDVGTTHTRAGVYRPDVTAVAERRAAPDDAEAPPATALRMLADRVGAPGAAPAAVGVAGMADPPVTGRMPPAGPAPEREQAGRERFLPIVTAPPPGLSSPENPPPHSEDRS